ncbi:luciferase family protein [Streptomyces mirabilis]|uniref:luciferase family protein n=1 Tax=Streptomyces mirabilis TaxID=68239 RepID=UPI00331E5D10
MYVHHSSSATSRTHFHSGSSADLYLTIPAIRRLREELERSVAVTLQAASSWATESVALKQSPDQFAVAWLVLAPRGTAEPVLVFVRTYKSHGPVGSPDGGYALVQCR